MPLDTLRGQMADVKIDAIMPPFLHLVVNSPRDDISGGKFRARVVPFHEGISVWQQESTSLTPNSF